MIKHLIEQWLAWADDGTDTYDTVGSRASLGCLVLAFVSVTLVVAFLFVAMKGWGALISGVLWIVGGSLALVVAIVLSATLGRIIKRGL